jgi:hypothetical protein
MLLVAPKSGSASADSHFFLPVALRQGSPKMEGLMNQRATDQDVQPDFSETVDHFIKRYCRRGTGLNTSDRALFHEFRVELAERGFHSNGTKRPRWYGLALHRLTVLNEKEE